MSKPITSESHDSWAGRHVTRAPRTRAEKDAIAEAEGIVLVLPFAPLAPKLSPEQERTKELLAGIAEAVVAATRKTVPPTATPQQQPPAAQPTATTQAEPPTATTATNTQP